MELDVSQAGTIGDVADLISNFEVDGRQLAVTLLPDAIRVEYADGLGGTLAIDDVAGGTLARDLGIRNADGLTPPPLIGNGLAPRVTLNSEIADLNGGAGLNLAGGIQIRQGDRLFTVDLDDAETIGDVIIAINRSGADVRAELNEDEGRIQIRSLRSGVDYSIGENGGLAATELGIRSADGQTQLSELGRGLGLSLNDAADDLLITRPDGVQLSLDLDGLETIDEVIDLIRNHPLNQDPARVLVDLNDFGNGITLEAPPGAGPLQIEQLGVSDAGNRLGLIPAGSDQASSSLVAGVETILGTDYLPRDAGGALDTLLRLRTAVENSDFPEIERLQARLDDDLDRSSQTRGRVGAWAKTLGQLRDSTEEKVIELRGQLSNEVDADLAEVISELQQRQLSLQASLQVIAQTSQLTLLNFL